LYIEDYDVPAAEPEIVLGDDLDRPGEDLVSEDNDHETETGH
jgi:hypothetical protein